MQNKNIWFPHAMALYNVLVWGTTFISTKVLLDSFSPLEILIYRFLIGYIALWCLRPQWLRWQGLKKEVWYLIAGLSGVTIYFLGENISLTMTYTGNVSIIVSTAPLFTAIFASLFTKTERPTKYFWGGFILAIMGIVIINIGATQIDKAHLMGDLLALGAASVWGIYSVVLKEYVGEQQSVIVRTRRIFFYGLLTMMPCILLMKPDFHPERIWQPLNVGNLLFLGILATAAAYATWNYAVARLGVMKSSVYIYLIPVVTIICSAVILNEKITPGKIIGCVLTMFGLILSEKRQSRLFENLCK